MDRTAYKNRYIKEHYDRINFVIPKSEKDRIKKICSEIGGKCQWIPLYFSLDDVMAITGESQEELLQRIEQCRQELIEAGENPDEYFKPVEPQRAAVYYFPNGLH